MPPAKPPRPTSGRCACGDEFTIAANGPISEQCHECRKPVHERKATERTALSAARATKKTPAPPPATVARNERGSVLTSEVQYTDDEWEFVSAMELFKKLRRRPFPTWSECLAVARSLGYRKVAESEPLPGTKE